LHPQCPTAATIYGLCPIHVHKFRKKGRKSGEQPYGEHAVIKKNRPHKDEAGPFASYDEGLTFIFTYINP